MSTHSSGSGSDTSLESHEQSTTIPTGTKRKLVIDTRRAEQNRAAQRAFRQRKELYVKELEGKVRDMEILKDRVERLEMENERLKYRVWELESSPNSTSTVAAPAAAPAANNSTNTSPTPPMSTSSTSYHSNRTSHGDDESESAHYSQQSHYHHRTTSNNTVRTIDTNEPPSPTRPLTHPPITTTTTAATVTHHILPPPSPSPSVFRPIPVAYWDKDNSKPSPPPPSIHQPHHHHHHHHPTGDDSTTPSEQGRVLDDLVSILRTRHRPPIGQQHQPLKPEPMHT